MSGGTVEKNTAKNGGSAYVTGGTYALSGGIIANNNSSENGGAISVEEGNFEMTGGTISNNQAKGYGGGIYAASDSTNLTVTVASGSIIGNVASKNGGGFAVNMGAGLKADVTIGLESCKGLDNTHSHPIIKDNIANENGGGFWLNGDNMTLNMYCGNIDSIISCYIINRFQLITVFGNILEIIQHLKVSPRIVYTYVSLLYIKYYFAE